jgi:intracellular sulfur oxidation DsrE/DsrF family protein
MNPLFHHRRRHHRRALVAFTLTTLAALASAQSPAPMAPHDMPAEIVAPALAPAAGKEKAIFAVSDADPARWNLTLGNIGNAVDGIGKEHADIELVVYGPGIAMLKKESPVADKIAAALASGVRVVACRNSMRGFHLEPSDLAPGVGIVPSGVVELIRREHEGYAYVRS